MYLVVQQPSFKNLLQGGYCLLVKGSVQWCMINFILLAVNCLRFIRVEPIDAGEEYCYPEVEPKFDMDQLAALFGKCPLPGSQETGASQQPTSDPTYCPPPEIDPRDVPRKSPRQGRPAFSSPQPGPGMGFSYLGGNSMSVGSSSLKPMRQPSPGSSPNFNRKAEVPPVVPSRQGKPLAPPKPLPRPPPLTKHATAPVLMYTPTTLNSDGMLPVQKTNKIMYTVFAN